MQGHVKGRSNAFCILRIVSSISSDPLGLSNLGRIYPIPPLLLARGAFLSDWPEPAPIQPRTAPVLNSSLNPFSLQYIFNAADN